MRKYKLFDENFSLKELGIVTICALFVQVILGMVLFVCFAEACSRDPQGLSLDIRRKYESLKQEANKEGIEFALICAERSQEQQNALYAQGRTKPGKIVTWVKESKHTKGKAFDVAIKKDGVITWDPKEYQNLGRLGIKLGLTWGGTWKVKDYGHFEI